MVWTMKTKFDPWINSKVLPKSELWCKEGANWQIKYELITNFILIAVILPQVDLTHKPRLQMHQSLVRTMETRFDPWIISNVLPKGELWCKEGASSWQMNYESIINSIHSDSCYLTSSNGSDSQTKATNVKFRQGRQSRLKGSYGVKKEPVDKGNMNQSPTKMKHESITN